MEHQVPQLRSIRKPDELVKKFLAWMPEQENTRWLTQLSAENQATIIAEIDALCQDAGFELAWVVEEQVENETLAQMLRQTVLHSLAALHTASMAQPLLETYAELVTWLNNPAKRKYRQQTRQIYVLLSEQGVIPQAGADMLLDNRKIRWRYVVKTLQAAYRQDAAAVEQAVRAVLLAPSSEPRQGLQKWLPFGPKSTAQPATEQPTGVDHSATTTEG